MPHGIALGEVSGCLSERVIVTFWPYEAIKFFWNAGTFLPVLVWIIMGLSLASVEPNVCCLFYTCYVPGLHDPFSSTAYSVPTTKAVIHLRSCSLTVVAGAYDFIFHLILLSVTSCSDILLLIARA